MATESEYSNSDCQETDDEFAAAAKVMATANPRSQQFKEAAAVIKKAETRYKKKRSTSPTKSSRKRKAKSPKPDSPKPKKSNSETLPQPPCGDGVPVTKNYSTLEKAEITTDLDFNGYVGQGLYVRISKYEKNKKQYVCIRRFADSSPGKYGANISFELIDNLKQAIDDVYALIKSVEEKQ